MNALDKVVRRHDIDCQSTHTIYGDEFTTHVYDCTCGANDARAELATMRAAVEEAQEREEAINEAITQITDWKDKAYPLDIFPEPDLKRTRELLKAGGMSLDVVSASNIRFALKRACEILAAALERLK